MDISEQGIFKDIRLIINYKNKRKTYTYLRIIANCFLCKNQVENISEYYAKRKITFIKSQKSYELIVCIYTKRYQRFVLVDDDDATSCRSSSMLKSSFTSSWIHAETETKSATKLGIWHLRIPALPRSTLSSMTVRK